MLNYLSPGLEWNDVWRLLIAWNPWKNDQMSVAKRRKMKLNCLDRQPPYVLCTRHSKCSLDGLPASVIASLSSRDCVHYTAKASERNSVLRMQSTISSFSTTLAFFLITSWGAMYVLLAVGAT